MQLANVTAPWKNVPLMSVDIDPLIEYLEFQPQTITGHSYTNRFTRVGTSLTDAIAAAGAIAKRFEAIEPGEPGTRVNGAQAVLQGIDGAYYVTRLGGRLRLNDSPGELDIRLPIDGRVKIDEFGDIQLRRVVDFDAITSAHPDLRAVVGTTFVQTF